METYGIQQMLLALDPCFKVHHRLLLRYSTMANLLLELLLQWDGHLHKMHHEPILEPTVD
jgi:hypothetical protein